MDCYIWYSEEGYRLGGAVPDVAGHRLIDGQCFYMRDFNEEAINEVSDMQIG